jgi:hypothetical protein
LVGHDSIILPGREGKVTGEVNASNLHGGAFKKYITISSNAKNTPSLRVSMGGTMKSEIDASSSYIRMAPEPKKDAVENVTLTSDFKDLKVTEVTFAMHPDNNASTPAWQASLPIYVGYSFAKADKPRTDGGVDYMLKLTVSYVDKVTKAGEFVIKTNDPNKAELRISGSIEGKGP